MPASYRQSARLAGFALILIGCPTHPQRIEDSTQQPDLTGLSVELGADTFQHEGPEDIIYFGNAARAAYDGILRDQLIRGLSRQNVKVFVDKKGGAPLRLRVTTAVSRYTSFGCANCPHLDVSLSALSSSDDSVVVTSPTVSCEMAESPTECIETIVPQLVRAFAESRQVQKLAANPPGSTKEVSANQAASSAPEPSASAPDRVADGQAALVKGSPQRTAYALVVGIENYRDLPAPSGARADADVFAAVLKNTLGLPESNIRVAVDERATGKDLERHLVWLKNSVPAGGRAYFFFSGHGAPDAAKGTQYLVPYDGDAQSIVETSVPMQVVLDALKATKATEAIAFVDACFSGAGGRSVMPKGARPLVRVKESVATGTVALFASSSGAEISGPSADGKNGAFTRYLVEGIGQAKADADGDGQLTLKELVEWVTPRVAREAKQQNRVQTPRLATAASGRNPKDVAVAWGLK